MKKTFGTFYGIDWKHCADAVFQLQCAIAKAWQADNRQRVHELQDTLVHKFEARALAVKKVRTNPGGKTPGVDGIVWDNDARLMGAINMLRNMGTYHPRPVKRVYLPKAKGGRRPLGIPTMYDRAVQTLFAFALMPIAECTADSRSYGYRPYKSAHDAATYLKLVLGAPHGKRWVLEADIEKFFDNLSHEWLLKHTPMNKDVLEKFLNAGFMEPPKGQIYATPTGTPQGGVISPIIANMALDGLEAALKDHFRVVRFADDFVVIGASREALKGQALPAVAAFLAERGLTLSQDKTKITSIEEGFDFLGFTFREYEDAARAVGSKKGIFLVTPAKARVIRFKRRLKRILTSLQHSSPVRVIATLNPILRGWVQYYKPVNSKTTFSAVGAYVWARLWRWCRRKHPQVPLQALREKYFMGMGGNNWVFHARDGNQRTVTLVQLGWTKIVRHTLCANLNPFLEENKAYYLQRRTRGATQSALLNANQSTLLKKQKGLCPVCHGALLDGEPLEVHHIKPRKLGGKDILRNLLLLHGFCHKQVTHSKNIRLQAAWRKGGIMAEDSSSTPGALF